MEVYIFRCAHIKLMGAATNQRDGANLPTDECTKWNYSHVLELDENSKGLIAADPQQILSDIERQGYSILRAEIETTETIIPNK